MDFYQHMGSALAAEDIGNKPAPRRRSESTGWNDARVELLKKLWNDGLSASQCAKRIGGGLTRNAVIGKVNRLGLSARKKAEVRSRRRARTKPPIDRESRKFISGEPPAALPPEPQRPEKLVSFAELEPHQCRFIYGDPKTADFGFCGCKTEPGLPYCAGHMQACCRKHPLPKFITTTAFEGAE